MRRLLVIAIATLFQAFPAAAQDVGQPGFSGPVTLAAGDILRINVWRRDELSGEFQIAADGTIGHPLYRQVNVAGIPLPDVELRIRQFLTAFEANPSFVLAPLMRVFVGGEVRSPGLFTVAPGTTVAQAVALSGGATATGRLDRTTLVRPPQRHMLDLTEPTSASIRIEVRSGDQVLVGRRRSLFREVIAPSSSVVGALAALVSIIVQVSR